MIKCENPCPFGRFNGCCRECPMEKSCEDPCEYSPDKCETAVIEGDQTALAMFRRNQLDTLNAIAALITHKKALEEQEKDLKKSLYDAMAKFGIKKFESEVLNLTLVEPTTVTSVDSTKLKKLYPAIADECSKVTSKAGYIKVTLKGDRK